MPQFVWQIVAGIIIAAASAWITVQLSLKRFRTERWWERKVESYTNVIEALHDSKLFAHHHLRVKAAGQKVQKETNEELLMLANEANAKISKAADVGAFLLSEEAHLRLKKYYNETDEASKKLKDKFYEFLDVDLKLTEECLKDFIIIAKKDLKTR